MSKRIRWINVVAVLTMIVINVLANALPINGKGTGEISDSFQVYFVPAGYVFSIWGLIYLALIAFAVYQVLPVQQDNPRLQRIGALFAISSLANIAWIFLWHYEQFELTLVAMVTLLLTLIAIYLRLGVGRGKVPSAERWLVHLPFSIYLGWITVATAANVTSLLDHLNWGGWGIAPEIWAVIILVVASGIATAVSFTRGDVAYMLVILWAFAGIGVKQADSSLVAGTAWAMTGLLAIVLVAGAFFHRRRSDAAANNVT